MDYKLNLNFTRKDKMLDMNKTSEIRILDVKGLESSSYTIHTADMYGDGVHITGRKTEAREITITGDIDKNENEDINRKNLISFFNPKYTGNLIVTRIETQRQIEYEVSSLDFSTNKLYDYIQFTLVLECPDPYFKSIDNYGKNIAEITKQFAFPLGIINEKGQLMGVNTFKDNLLITNNGDVETGVEIVAKARGGNVYNPFFTLTNAEGKSYKISVWTGDVTTKTTKLTDGKSVSINTNKGHKTVSGGYINAGSTFFELLPGDNYIQYDAEEGKTNMDVYVYFYERFLGV